MNSGSCRFFSEIFRVAMPKLILKPKHGFWGLKRKTKKTSTETKLPGGSWILKEQHHGVAYKIEKGIQFANIQPSSCILSFFVYWKTKQKCPDFICFLLER